MPLLCRDLKKGITLIMIAVYTVFNGSGKATTNHPEKIMSKQIVVQTQKGVGGPVTVEGRWNAGPRNLLAAVKTAHDAIEQNRGVAGYRTWIEIDGEVLSNWETSWPATMAEAREALS